MNHRQGQFFAGQRPQMTDSIRLTIESLLTYGPRHEHWAIAWSGGKDSSTLVTLVIYLLLSGKVPPPKTLTVLYADTRLELLPLWFAAQSIQEEMEEQRAALGAIGVTLDVRVVMAPLDKRFLVYVLGRGVPPPNNNTLRWCTRQIKIDPMVAELRRLHGDRGGKVLMLTGVRGAVRHARAAAPLARLSCMGMAAALGDAYGGDEAEEINARTGCVGCPLANHDTALDAVLARPAWAYLAPLKELRPLWRELREPPVRLRKRGLELRKDGTPAANPQRMGPITLEARAAALARVLDVQARVNRDATQGRRPPVDLINIEEETRIRELIAARTWPDGWGGDEPTGDVHLEQVFADGTVQPLLPFEVA